MILNEDYFKDIEISGDDIQVPDILNTSPSSQILTDDIDDDNISRYKQSLLLLIQHKTYSEENMNMLAYYMNYFFDTYSMVHSPIYYVKGHIFFIDNANVHPYKNFISIENKSLEEPVFFDTVVIYYRDLKFSNVKQMLKFVCSLSDILNKKQIGIHIENICLYNQIMKLRNSPYLNGNDCCMYIYNSSISFFKNILKTGMFNYKFATLNDMYFYDLVRWFFGKKTEKHIKYVQNTDKTVDWQPVPGDKPLMKKE